MKFPTHEEIYPEILRAIKLFGIGTFENEENQMLLTVDKAGEYYRASFKYQWTKYSFDNIHETELEEVAA